MANNEELARALKDLPLRIQTASRKERREVLENVSNVLSNPGVSENVIRGICKVLQITLSRYRDHVSQSYVINLIRALCKQYPDWTMKFLTPVLTDVASSSIGLTATTSTAVTSLYALTWSTVLVNSAVLSCSGDGKPEFQNVVNAQALLLSCVVAANNKRKTEKAQQLLFQMWKSNPATLALYEGGIPCIPESIYSVIFGSFFVKYCAISKLSSTLEQQKGKLLESFVKVVIGSKTKLGEHVTPACKPLLMLIEHQEFSESVLPALQKALLRSPEVSLSTTAKLLSCLSVDLSSYAVAIGKSVASSLTSTDEIARYEATTVFSSLAPQISDSTPLQSLVDLLFQLFHGSQGKITVAAHKMTILQAIGNLSSNPVGGSSSQTLAQFVTDQFVKVLQVEVHEKTLIHCLEMMSLWCPKLTSEIPPELLKNLEKGMALKSSTACVRAGYISVMSACVSSKTCDQMVPYIPLLLKSVEKAAAQPTQVGVVIEGLGASCLLLKLAAFNSALTSQLSPMYQALLAGDRQLFLSEKFLNQAPVDALCNVVVLCEKLLMEESGGVIANPDPIYRAMVQCIVVSGVRTRCRPIFHRLFSSLQGTAIACALLEHLAVLLSSGKLQVILEKDKENVSSDANNQVLELKPKYLVDAILTICSGNNLSKDDKKQIAFHALLACHHPSVVFGQTDLWLKIIKHFQLDGTKFVKEFQSKFIELLVTGFKSVSGYDAALSTVCSMNSDVTLPPILKSWTEVFSDPTVLNVSDQEYAIYLTPSGELYDKSVIAQKEENLLNQKNMKRESKAYSYKEQQEEIALRKELEEKRRKEGKVKEPELTPKQKEALKAQLDKEAVIREKLAKGKERLEMGFQLIICASKGSGQELSKRLPSVVPVLVRAFNSPLAAPLATRLYLELSQPAFQNSSLPMIERERLAHSTLSLLNPRCDLDPAWEIDATESMNWAIARLALLANELPASALAFVLPLLEAASNRLPPTSPLLGSAISLLSVQAKLREGVHHPDLLPRRQMIALLLDLVANTAGRSQQQAVNALLELATATSGAPGCAAPTERELELFLTALQHFSQHVRDAALRSLIILARVLPRDLTVVRRVWVARHDVVPENRTTADKLWESAQLTSQTPGLCESLIEDIIHPVSVIQQSGAYALAALLKDSDPSKTNLILDLLLQVYSDKNNMIPAKVDSLGRIVEKPIDTWEPRRGVALALEQMAPLLTPQTVEELARFFVERSLGDRAEQVRAAMLAAALAAVDLHGKDTVNSLLPVLEPVLDKGPDCSSYDSVRQSVVILMGSLAKHLDKDDRKIKPIVAKLIDALSTPSQQVQEAVANCLPALVPSIKDEAPALVEKLLDQLLNSESYGQRKGAAYGLAGIVKGMGILALKQLEIMNTLTTAIQDKKNYRHREGALFAFEMLCTVLGRLFEPYIVHVLPHLLLCFGDGNQYVREATDDCAKVVMSKLSAHGVKLVLPSLLAALEKDSWRTKTGSVDLLGAMAFCAPKQLSSCLPSIVPKLIEVLSDSHVKVQSAGAQALRQIGSVIKNPEIQAIVPTLLEALQDPSNKTALCLNTLLETHFVHFIDAPSLALIMPVVQRAFQDRSTETRKMAAQIIGNMYSLTDQKDLTPYLPTIIPGLKTSLLDPVPEVRSVSARALGAMVRGMGESSFEDLLPWLMQTLTSESSPVDRSGAAQGLSEVVGGLGVEKLHKLMPEIITTAQRSDIAPHVKDGYIMMFIYMPAVFTDEFTPYIGEIIIPILKALADENEYIRDTALKAGQRIVNLYADSAITLLLPELERGLFDDNWRIRYSSVQLLGDLLYKISGVSGKMSTETASEDDNFGTEQSHKAIIKALGLERRNRVLAGLYMGRSDVALMVRQASLHVWKVVVTNTPRTLREILPTLFNLLLGCLASTSHDKRTVAAKTLGDLVRKLGERVLPEIIPILERGLESDQPDQRQGVCIGLSEMMASTSRDMVLTFVNSLVPTVRKALCDPLPEVRAAAARTFDSLHSTVGVRCLDDILPPMVQQLNDPEVAEWTLDGLRQVMAIKSRVVLPYLVPQLTAHPVNTKALSILASVAGEALTKYLHKILPALLFALAASESSPQELDYCQSVVLSVTDEVGIRTIVDQLLEVGRGDQPEARRAAATLLCSFCTHTRADYSQYVPQLLRGLILLLTDQDPTVLQMAWDALNAVTKTLDASQQLAYVGDIRQAIKFATSDLGKDHLLPGLCLPKGITPILPIFREAILNGTPEVKEAAAQGLGEVISLSTAPSLQPSVVHITGPLIRILGDRFPPGVKAAVLQTLAILLGKVGPMLKQFLPQLQTTFLKALNDSNRQVRLRAAAALSHLIVIHTRPDPLFTEIHNAAKNAEDPSVRETMLQALRGVISTAGDKMSEPTRKPIYQSLLSMLSHPEDTTRSGAAGCIGALTAYLAPDPFNATLNDHLFQDETTLDWTLRHGRSAALFVALKEAPERVYTPENRDKIIKALLSYLAADRVPIAMNGIRGCGYVFQHMMNKGETIPHNLLSPFVRSMNHQSNEVKQLVAQVCSYLASTRPQLAPEFLKAAIPMLVNGTKEKNGYVKANSELSLVAVLHLRQGDDTLQVAESLLEPGARESLADVISKVLRKVAVQPEGKTEELDDTLLT